MDKEERVVLSRTPPFQGKGGVRGLFFTDEKKVVRYLKVNEVIKNN